MSKHTKGEWLIEETTVYFLDWDGDTFNKKGEQVLSNRFSATFQGQERRINREELLANARLAHAAPEMLEALKAACESYAAVGKSYWPAWVRPALAVIAKAKGA